MVSRDAESAEPSAPSRLFHWQYYGTVIQSLHDKTVDALVAAIGPALGNDEVIVSNVRWQSLEGFPESTDILDIAVVPRHRLFDESKLPCVGPGIPITTIINVIDAESFMNDFYHLPNILERSSAEEYLLFDPTSQLIRPGLQGFRRSDTGLERLVSCQLGVFFSRGDYRLVIRDGEINGCSCDTFREEELFEDGIASLQDETSREISRLLAKNARAAKREADAR